MDSTTNTPVLTTEPVRPIYGPADARWSALQAWFTDRAAEPFDARGRRRATMERLTPRERGEWFETRILGLSSDEVYWPGRGVEYPTFPESAPAPAWALEVDTESVDMHDRPVRVSRRLMNEWEQIEAHLVQTSTYDVASGTVIDGPVELWVSIDGAEPVVFSSLERVRQVFSVLWHAHDDWKQVIA